jgi:serine/threonine-protein kinase
MAMIELRGGDLSLTNIVLVSDASKRPKHWICVEDGLLALKGCRIRDPGGPQPAVGPLVAFRARTSDPIPARSGPFLQPVDRPICSMKNCILWAGANAVEAELGRGSLLSIIAY